jgi:hypothetical protein
LKATHFIPPVVALVLAGIWNAAQMRSISSLEKDAASLREKVSAAPVSGEAPRGGRRDPSAASTRKQPIDWKQLSNGTGELDDENLEEQIEEMTQAEILAALESVAALEEGESRDALESMLLDSLIQQDPELALSRFAGRITSDAEGIGWQLSTALGAWAKKDLTAATAWFDKQIAAGTFDSTSLDGKSEMRIQFESALMESLLLSDPNAAGQRLGALPEGDRREVLEQLPFEELGASGQKTYTELVRQLIPADEREGSFANIASQLVNDDGFANVSAFLDAVNASPAERAAAAIETAETHFETLAEDGKVTRADVDALRTWLERQAPGKVDGITGRALAEAAQEDGQFTLEEASRLVLDYQKSSGSDDVLVAFLKSYSARSNLKEVQELVNKIQDPKLRADITKELD